MGRKFHLLWLILNPYTLSIEIEHTTAPYILLATIQIYSHTMRTSVSNIAKLGSSGLKATQAGAVRYASCESKWSSKRYCSYLFSHSFFQIQLGGEPSSFLFQVRRDKAKLMYSAGSS